MTFRGMGLPQNAGMRRLLPTRGRRLGHVGSQSGPKPGDRVRVIRDPEWNGPWPAEPTGTVEPSESFQVIDIGDSTIIVLDDEKGEGRLFQVRFDEPQLDADGWGLFQGASVLEKYLVVLDGPPIEESR